jgi:hypothetical protein
MTFFFFPFPSLLLIPPFPPFQALKEVAAREHVVILINEDYTSQKCPKAFANYEQGQLVNRAVHRLRDVWRVSGRCRHEYVLCVDDCHFA